MSPCFTTWHIAKLSATNTTALRQLQWSNQTSCYARHKSQQVVTSSRTKFDLNLSQNTRLSSKFNIVIAATKEIFDDRQLTGIPLSWHKYTILWLTLSLRCVVRRVPCCWQTTSVWNKSARSCSRNILCGQNIRRYTMTSVIVLNVTLPHHQVLPVTLADKVHL